MTRHRHLGRGARGGARQRRAARPHRAGSLPRGDDPVGGAAGERPFDLIVANLPYVAERDWRGLQPEVTKWEPREALLAGPDGLDALRVAIPALAAAAPVSRWRSARGRPPAVGELLSRCRLRRDRDPAGPGRDPARRGGSEADAMSEDRLDRAAMAPPAARSALERLHRRGRRRGLPRRRPLRPRLRPARRGRDRAHPPDQGPRRRQALGGPVLLAAGDARAGRGARAAHRARRSARCCPAR